MHKKSWNQSSEQHFLFERPLTVKFYVSVWLIEEKNSNRGTDSIFMGDRYPGFDVQQLCSWRFFNWKRLNIDCSFVLTRKHQQNPRITMRSSRKIHLGILRFFNFERVDTESVHSHTHKIRQRLIPIDFG